MLRRLCVGLISGAAVSTSGCSGGEAPPAPDEGATPAAATPDASNGAAAGTPTATTPTIGVNPPGAEYSRPLIDAAKTGDVEALRAALEAGVFVDQGDYKFNNSPLMHAAIKGCIPCVELLLEHGANINHRNTAGATALMWASMEGSAPMVQLLLQRGADVHIATRSGRSALTVAHERTDDADKALIIVLLEQAVRGG